MSDVRPPSETSDDGVVHSPERDEGLHSKYHVERLHDPDEKHENCRYFVLDPKHDPIARRALASYAADARSNGYLALGDDLEAWIVSLYDSEEAGRPCD